MEQTNKYYIYGRILGVIEKSTSLTTHEKNSYIANPERNFAPLMQKITKKLVLNNVHNDRFGILIDMLEMEDTSSVGGICKPEEQSSVLQGYYKELQFWDSTIGEKIKQGRLNLNLTQEELAEKSGIKGGANTIARYENNEVKPKNDNAILLRNILGYKYI